MSIRTGTAPAGAPVSLWRRVTPHKVAFVFATALSVAQAVVSLAQPLVVASLIDSVGRSAEITTQILLLVALLLASACLLGLQQYLLAFLAESAVRDARKSIVRALLTMSFVILNCYRRGDLISRATSDTLLLRTALVQGTSQLISGVVTVIGAMVAMYLVDVGLLAMTAAVVVVSLGLVAVVARRLRTLASAAQEGIADYSSAIERALMALPTIRALNAVPAQVDYIDHAADRTWAHSLRFARVASWLTPATAVIMQASLIIVLGVGGFRVAQGTLAIAALISFIMYLVMLLGPLSQSAGAITALNQAFAANARLAEVESHQNLEETTTAEAEPSLQSLEAPSAGAAVEFRNVAFRYPGASQAPEGSSPPALVDISFTVDYGQKVAIVGPSGAGKTTILGLLERFYAPDSGTILVHGTDTATQSPANVRQNFGYVQQEAPILAGTVLENLRLGAPKASTERCLDALERVNLGHLARGGVDALSTQLGDQGVNLSGGERQRLALARAVLADRPILLLDEATSQIDSENERLLQNALSEAAGDRTQVVVAHRLSTVIDSDLIIVLRGGRIEDVGTHTDLLVSSDFYRSLAAQQHLV